MLLNLHILRPNPCPGPAPGPEAHSRLVSHLPRTAAWLHQTALAATGVRGYLASVGLNVDAPQASSIPKKSALKETCVCAALRPRAHVVMRPRQIESLTHCSVVAKCPYEQAMNACASAATGVRGYLVSVGLNVDVEQASGALEIMLSGHRECYPNS
eukprot:1158062-Pelagomonas_calceolata.AAC.2